MKNHLLIHLYNRVGFGILPKEVNKLNKLSIHQNVDLLFKQSKQVKHLRVNTTKLKELRSSTDRSLKKKEIQQENRELLKELNAKWYTNLYNTKALLHDKMKLFWTNHFVCSSNLTIETIDYLKVIDKYALGNFKDFVLAITQNPMMIVYLNNKQNRKKHPNENYARELMELFTLGIGNYTENDIKESARAFTGWSTDKANAFTFRKKQHDFGTKTFLGKTGDFDGTDIIDIILEQEQCALFICQKIYKEFVNPTPNNKHIQKMANVFRKNYEISELMEFVLKSDWFYDGENIGVKIKSPVELLVGIHNVIPFKFKKKRFFQYIQYNLGQKLLYPPNVAGWPGDRQWIDANTIMLRLKLASSIIQQKEIELKPESAFEDDFETINKANRKNNFLMLTTLDWLMFNKQTKGTDITDWQEALIGSKLSKETKDLINTFNTNTAKDFCISLMSLPEYQMC